MSILERSPSLPAPPADPRPRSDRLRVITAGDVGNMEARLGASGFDVVAVAETEDALIDAVTADEADAIVVEADLCPSLERVRALAPDAVLIVVGDHTPAGALGRIEPEVSGTVMAGLLHALVAEGVGAAVVWGLVPSFGSGAVGHVPQGVSASLLWAKADLLRAHLVNAVNAVRDHADIVVAATTVAVTASASIVLMVSAPRTHERPAPRPPTSAVVPAPAPPVISATRTTPTPAYGRSWDEVESGNRRGPTRGESKHHGRHHHQGVHAGNGDQGVNPGNDDQGVNPGNDDQGVNPGNDDQGEDEGSDDQGVNPGNDDQGRDEGSDDQGEDEGNDDQGVIPGSDDQGVIPGSDDQGVNPDNDDQGEDEGNDSGAI